VADLSDAIHQANDVAMGDDPLRGDRSGGASPCSPCCRKPIDNVQNRVIKYMVYATDYVVCNWIRVDGRRESELDPSGRSQDPRRAGARILDTAEGVLIALRGCTLNDAFVEIVQTAKAHNVSTMSLADALVALAQGQASPDGQDVAVGAARAAWAHLLDRARPRRSVLFGRDDDDVPSA